MSDIYSGIDAYRDRVVEGQSVKSRGTSFLDPRTVTFGGEELALHGGVSSKIVGTVADPSVRTLNALGLANPLLTAWELTPFSFVVDWFMPISDILAYLSSNLGLKNVYRVDHRVVSRTWEYYKQGVWNPGETRKTIVREVSLNPTVSWPDITWLGFSASVNRVATAAALVRANVR